MYESESLADLWEAVSLAENERKVKGRARRGELEARLRELVRTWAEIPGDYARRIAREEIERAEAELAALNARPEFARQLRSLQRELVAVYRAVSKARSEGDPLAKSRLLRGLVERIDCHFTFRELGVGKSYSKLLRVDFHPLRRDGFTTSSGGGPGRRPSAP